MNKKKCPKEGINNGVENYQPLIPLMKKHLIKTSY